MLSSGDLFSIPYYEKGAAFTGSQRDFRFRVEKAEFSAEEPSDENEADGADEKKPVEKKLKLTIYPDRFCYDVTEPEDKREQFFDYTSEGLGLIIDTINNTEKFV